VQTFKPSEEKKVGAAGWWGRGDNKHTLGSLRKITIGGTKLGKAMKMMGEEISGPSHSRVISIPSLQKLREFCFQLTNEWEGGESISHHSHRITLCNTFLAIEVVTSAIVMTDHKCAPMAVGIETKPGTRGPFMSNNPQHGCPIELIEGITGINEQKSPVFRSMVDIPGMLHEMNGTFNASRKAGTELVSTTCFSGSRTSNLRTDLASTQCQVSPMPMGQTPALLSRARRQPVMRAQ